MLVVSVPLDRLEVGRRHLCCFLADNATYASVELSVVDSGLVRVTAVSPDRITLGKPVQVSNITSIVSINRISRPMLGKANL